MVRGGVKVVSGWWVGTAMEDKVLYINTQFTYVLYTHVHTHIHTYILYTCIMLLFILE